MLAARKDGTSRGHPLEVYGVRSVKPHMSPTLTLAWKLKWGDFSAEEINRKNWQTGGKRYLLGLQFRFERRIVKSGETHIKNPSKITIKSDLKIIK